MKTLRLILLLLLPFSRCVDARVFSNAFPSHDLSITLPSLVDLVAVGDDDFIAVSHPPGEERVTRIHIGGEETLSAVQHKEFPLGEALIARRDAWWYSSAFSTGRVAHVAFVTANGRQVVDLPRLPLLWLPIPGDKPEGVLLSLDDDRSTFVLETVSAAGPRPLGKYPGHLPGTAPLPRNWSVQRLPDGRIAILSLEQSVGGPWRFMLRVFDGGGGVAESPLPCADSFRQALATAVDDKGRIAAVALSPRREIVSETIDVDAPQRSRCGVLSQGGETAAVAVRGTPSVIATDTGFIAAWIRSDGTVRATRLGTGIVADVGADADPVDSLAHLASAGDDPETLSFAWKGDRGVVQRRLPRSLDGYAFIIDAERMLADFVARLRQ